ncbi:MAG: hypothetical protein ACLQVL_17945, partial [Terriglobia bacterium]
MDVGASGAAGAVAVGVWKVKMVMRGEASPRSPAWKLRKQIAPGRLAANARCSDVTFTSPVRLSTTRYFWVASNAPAVAIELGRLSPDAESAALTNPAFQQQIAGAVVQALDGFGKGGN